MLVEFEKELISELKKVHEKTAPYLGELENKDEFELLIKGGDEFVFVEFVSESYDDKVNKTAVYNVHILSATSSKQQIYRQENKFKAIALCEKIDEELRNLELCNEFEITPKSLKVFHNSLTEYGYMYVLTRQIQTKFLKKDEWLEE
ncbi:hypothetical protein U5B43_09920 [Campylobacter sp. 9BO]|uniref:hypothetical protein n=1 Tax=Campylobacter sp. 9BO TaxID=3424759 RepID=UPI003D34E218